MKLIDKDALVAEIEKRMQELHPTNTHQMQVGEKMSRDVLMWLNALTWALEIIDTLEVKEVIAEQECTCNEPLNRIIGGSWNLLCPVNKLGLKTGDKVKVIIKAMKE